MSNLSDLLPAGAGAKAITATADGNLATGQTVALKSDGTVKVIATDGATEALGSQVVFQSGTMSEFFASCYDPDTGKTIIAFGGTDTHGWAVVGTPASDNSITFGTPVKFVASSVEYVAISYDTDQDRVLIAYSDKGNGYDLMALVGTVSGDTISYGSATTVEGNDSRFIKLAYSPDTANHMVIYQDNGNGGRGAARCLTVTGGSTNTVARTNPEVLYNSNSQISSQDVVYDTTNDKFIVAYRDHGNSYYGGMAVGSISGTTITFGSPASLNAANTNDIALAFDSTNGKTVVLYKASQDPRSRVISVSGTTPSAGSETVIASLSGSGQNGLAFDSLNGKLVAAFDNEDTSRGQYAVGTVSGTSITFATPVDFNTDGRAKFNAPSFNASVNKIVLVFQDNGNSQYGTAQVLQLVGANFQDFVGITNQAINNSASGEVVVEGGVITNGSLLPLAYTGSLGSAAVYESAQAEYQGVAYDSSNNRVVVAYKDDGNSSHGTAAVGTVSGTGITWGTPVVFEAASTSYVRAAFDSSNNKIVIAYSDVANSEHGTAIVGTVSGTSISFGSPAVFNAGATTHLDITFDSNSNKVVISYRDNGNSSYGTAIVGTVSGTSISFGSEVVYNSSSAAQNFSVFDSSNNKVVIVYKSTGNSSYGTASVGTVSGTSISFGSQATFSNNSTINTDSVITFDSNANKVVVFYGDTGNSTYATAVVGTVSGTDISFGTPVVVDDAAALSMPGIGFDSNANQVILVYQQVGTARGYYRVGTVSGTSISFQDRVTLNENYISYNDLAFDTGQNTTVIVYRDGGNSNYGTAKGLQLTGAVPNFTIGSTYYVQTDGTLSTTSSSVTAGKAIANTTLLLKG